MESKKLALRIADQMFEKKGFDVLVMDLSKIASFADYFVICSADSDTQVKAIADDIDKKLRDDGIKPWHREGYSSLSWVLLDYVDVVVHVFKKDSRAFYNLEKLWGDAPLLKIEDPTMVKVKTRKEKSTVSKTPKKANAVKKGVKKATSMATKKTTTKTSKVSKKGSGTKKK